MDLKHGRNNRWPDGGGGCDGDGRMQGAGNDGEQSKRNKMKREDVSWSNIHITNELREGLLVEVFIQHPGQTSAQRQSSEKAGEKRQRWKGEEGGNTTSSVSTQSEAKPYNQRLRLLAGRLAAVYGGFTGSGRLAVSARWAADISSLLSKQTTSVRELQNTIKFKLFISGLFDLLIMQNMQSMYQSDLLRITG